MSLHRYLTKLGYSIDKNEITKKELLKLKKDLTVKPYDPYGDPDEFELFRETKEYIHIPKYYGMENYGKAKGTIKMDGMKVNFKFNGTLREFQENIAKDTINQLKKEGGGILSLYCGAGKTVLALYLAAAMGLKTLVVVNKTFLQNQWKARIQQFTDAEVGIIRQRKIEVDGKDIVIGMLQSISMIDYDSGIFTDFGLVIYDEVHRFGSKIFSNSLYKTTSRYTLGLSATPDRGDGLTKVLVWYIGEIFFRLKRPKKYNAKIKTYVISYSTDDPLFVTKKRWIPKLRRMDYSNPKMISNICMIKNKNKMIKEIVHSLRILCNRRIIILTSRVEHMKKLKRDFDKDIKKLTQIGELQEGELITAMYYGDMKPYELQCAEETADIFFATYHMAQEGLDVKGLNTVLLASPPPKRDIEQSVGRAMREELKTCVINPLIIDISDDLPGISNMCRSRKEYYERENYDCHYIYSYNGTMMSHKKYLKNALDMDKDEIDKYIKSKYKSNKISFELSTKLDKYQDNTERMSKMLENVDE